MSALNTNVTDSQRINGEILRVLRDAGGEQMSPYIMARKIGQALASTRQTMADLAATGGNPPRWHALCNGVLRPNRIAACP